MYTESQATIIEVGSDGSDVCTPGDPISDQRTEYANIFYSAGFTEFAPSSAWPGQPRCCSMQRPSRGDGPS